MAALILFHFLQTLWFLAPILAANVAPGYAANLNLPLAQKPVSTSLLGRNKTWGAYYAAPLAAIFILWVEYNAAPWSKNLWIMDHNMPKLLFVGAAIGLGSILGDHVKSFFKRRREIPSGDPWKPFDQMDFLAGALLASWPLIGWIGWDYVVAATGFVLIIHPLGNGLGHRAGLRKQP